MLHRVSTQHIIVIWALTLSFHMGLQGNVPEKIIHRDTVVASFSYKTSEGYIIGTQCSESPYAPYIQSINQLLLPYACVKSPINPKLPNQICKKLDTKSSVFGDKQLQKNANFSTMDSVDYCK